MTRRTATILLALAGLSAAAAAQRYTPAFRPDRLTDHPAGPANQVLVLGSPHLSALPPTFRPEMVETLLARLAGWRPTAVATETISGLNCAAMRAQRERQADAVATYCYDPAAAGRATGLDVVAAAAEAERLLAAWPSAPSPAERRRLALVFLAAGEPGSAMVQWYRLPTAERRAEGALTAALAADLQARTTRRSETELVAAQLAARVGLERLWSVDDQSFVGAPIDDKAYGTAVERAWNNPVTREQVAAETALMGRIERRDGLLDLYRALNAPDYAAQKYRSDWGAALTEPSLEGYGRRYVAYWETRNLRMVANIREVLGRAPGTRLVALVGAAHRGYYEAYLAQMRDVTLVDTAAVLR